MRVKEGCLPCVTPKAGVAVASISWGLSHHGVILICCALVDCLLYTPSPGQAAAAAPLALAVSLSHCPVGTQRGSYDRGPYKTLLPRMCELSTASHVKVCNS